MSDDAMHDLILDELKELGLKVDSLSNRMFVGNGQPSLASQIQDNGAACKSNASKLRTIWWCVSVIYIGVVTGIVGLIIKNTLQTGV